MFPGHQCHYQTRYKVTYSDVKGLVSIGTGRTESKQFGPRVVDGNLKAIVSFARTRSTHLASVSSCSNTNRKVSSTSIKKRRGADGVTSSVPSALSSLKQAHHARVGDFD